MPSNPENGTKMDEDADADADADGDGEGYGPLLAFGPSQYGPPSDGDEIPETSVLGVRLEQTDRQVRQTRWLRSMSKSVTSAEGSSDSVEVWEASGETMDVDDAVSARNSLRVLGLAGEVACKPVSISPQASRTKLAEPRAKKSFEEGQTLRRQG